MSYIHIYTICMYIFIYILLILYGMLKNLTSCTYIYGTLITKSILYCVICCQISPFCVLYTVLHNTTAITISDNNSK